MIKKALIFIILSLLFFGFEFVYEPELLLQPSNTDSIISLIGLQIVGSSIFIAAILIWTCLTKERRKKKIYQNLSVRIKKWIPLFPILLLLGVLRNNHNASNWVEALKHESIMMASLILFILPVFIFYFTFFQSLGGLKRSEQIGGEE